jgi:membrane dipeptidase
MVRFVLIAAALVLAPSVALAQAPTAAELARLDRIVRTTPIIDGHNDLPWAIRDDHNSSLEGIDLNADTRTLTPPLQTDIPRLRAGRVGAQFWSVYVPASLRGEASTQAVREQIALTREIIAAYPETFEFAESAADISRIYRAGRIASMFGMEGGEAINNSLETLREFRAAGVLYMTLAHSATTDWVDSATDAPRHGGLSPFGEEVVREMNRIGMFVDLSHVSAEAMRDALAISRAPVIFSHSSAMALNGHPRNVPDDVLALVRRNRGVVMVTFFPGFISEDLRQWVAVRSGEDARLRSLNPGDPEAVTAGMAAWMAANPLPQTDVAALADHIEHIASIGGHGAVGLGGDYDGVPFLPTGMEGVDGYPLLFAELMRRGWSDSELRMLAGGNLLRALREAERVARWR